MSAFLAIARIVWLGVLRRKDVYILLFLLGTMLLCLASMNVFGLGNTVRYVADVGLLFTWIFAWILSINVTARELPQEQSRGTIFPLLAKPINRWTLIAGKWMGAWTVVTVATACFYLTVLAIVLLRGGHWDGITLGQTFCLHTVALGLMAAIALMFSTRLNHDAAATLSFILTGASLLVVPRIPEFMVRETGLNATALMVLYHALPHLEVFDMRQRLIHDFGPIPWQGFGLITLYGIILILIILLFAWIAFRTRRFIRGELYS